MSEKRGAAAAEAALVIAVVAVLLLGLVEIGLLLKARLALEAAVWEVARQAAVDGGRSDAAVSAATEALTAAGLDPARAQVAIEPARPAYGGQMRVELVYPYHLRLLPAHLGRADGVVALAAAAVVRSERGGAP